MRELEFPITINIIKRLALGCLLRPCSLRIMWQVLMQLVGGTI